MHKMAESGEWSVVILSSHHKIKKKTFIMISLFIGTFHRCIFLVKSVTGVISRGNSLIVIPSDNRTHNYAYIQLSVKYYKIYDQ